MAYTRNLLLGRLEAVEFGVVCLLGSQRVGFLGRVDLTAGSWFGGLVAERAEAAFLEEG